MTAPEIYKPIINSVNDLATKPDVHVTVTKGMLADVIFQVIIDLFKNLCKNNVKFGINTLRAQWLENRTGFSSLSVKN